MPSLFDSAKPQPVSQEQSTFANALEKAFIQIAKSYAEQKGLTYQDFRKQGVSKNTLLQAGIEP